MGKRNKKATTDTIRVHYCLGAPVYGPIDLFTHLGFHPRDIQRIRVSLTAYLSIYLGLPLPEQAQGIVNPTPVALRCACLFLQLIDIGGYGRTDQFGGHIGESGSNDTTDFDCRSPTSVVSSDDNNISTDAPKSEPSSSSNGPVPGNSSSFTRSFKDAPWNRNRGTRQEGTIKRQSRERLLK